MTLPSKHLVTYASCLVLGVALLAGRECTAAFQLSMQVWITFQV